MLRRNFRIKILLVGDGGVGKSTFREVWLGRAFRANYIMTLGADFAAKQMTLEYNGSETYGISYQIWDLAGQPRFKVVSDLYYRGAAAALCFFDITNRDSFLNIENWIISYWKLNGKGVKPILLIGAKSDLREAEVPEEVKRNFVQEEEGRRFARLITREVQKDYGFTVHYIETSAKENKNVDKTFEILGRELINNLKFQIRYEPH